MQRIPYTIYSIPYTIYNFCLFTALCGLLDPFLKARYGTMGENASIPSKLEELNKTCRSQERR